MNTASLLWFVWPWVGAGAAVAIVLMLFFSDAFHPHKDRSRWFDTTWLSWGIAAAYLFHVLEEYGMHVENGQYALITNFQEMGVDEMFGGLPLAFFPYMNILLTWLALPVAAVLSKKHPVIGLSGMGFLLFNCLTHVGGAARMHLSISENAGVFTAFLLFLPLFIWICYACKKGGLLPKKGLGIAITSGILGHLMLFLGYILNMVAGHTATFVFIPFVAFSPLIFAWCFCKLFHVNETEAK